jgi:hypothetical protein
MNDMGFRAATPGGLRQAGRHADALALLREQFAGAARAGAPAPPGLFLVMLEWAFLAAEYAPARTALEHARDEQIGRLLAGDTAVGPEGDRHPAFLHGSRFALVAEMNRVLGDARSTYDVFVRLDAMRPDLARRHAFLALPSVVAAGDFALADRYRGDPLAHLAAVNETAAAFPLFPPPDQAPRLAAELTLVVNDVRIAGAVLRGRGRTTDALALRAHLLAGLPSGAVRMLAQRELDEEGTIMRAIVAHQAAQGPLAGCLPPRP